MLLKVDIGIDELDSHLFQIAVIDNRTKEIYCHVYGKSPEQCEARANDLVYAYNFSAVTD